MAKRRNFIPHFACTVEPLAGSTVLNSVSCPNLPSNSSSSLNLTYASGANNPLSGQALTINLSLVNPAGGFYEAFFDDISLSARTAQNGDGEEVPEPSAALLFGAGVVCCAALRQRKA